MIKTVKCFSLLICSLLFAGCATTDFRNSCEQFEKSYKDYNRMLRWNEASTAGSMFVEPGGRELFKKTADDLKKRSVAITEYRVLTAECLPAKSSGEVTTEFDYYVMPSNRIKTLTYKQTWTYLEVDGSRSWKVKSALPLFE
jgi:hypothetical protein